MSEPAPPDKTPKPDRSQLWGRLIIVAFGLLLAIYLVPLALSFLD